MSDEKTSAPATTPTPPGVQTDLSETMNELVLSRPENKEQFFKFLGVPLGDYDLTMSNEVATAFKNSIISLKTGLHARVPMVCPGGKMCPVGRQCDFTQFAKDKETGAIVVSKEDSLPIINMTDSRWPIGKPCPYDTALISMRIRDLCEEFSVDPTDTASTTDMSVISKLAELDIYDARASSILAREHLIMDETTGYELSGDHREIKTKRLHPAFEVKEKIHRMRQDLIKSMVGDRQSKVKAQAALGSTANSTMTDALSALRRKLEANSATIINVEAVEIGSDDDFLG